LFPYLPGQSGYGKRLRALSGLLAAVITELARDCASWHDEPRLLDSTPLPCAASRETVNRSDLAGHAGYGYCASHSRFFWGFRLYLIAAPDGMPIIWGLANPKIGEREVTQALLERDHHLVRAGQLILGDKGFAGREFDAFVRDDLGARLLRPDRRNEPTRHGNLARVRQWNESIFDTLKGQLALEEHGGRTLRGVYARVAARRHGRSDLEQLEDRRTGQTLHDRLRSIKRTHSFSRLSLTGSVQSLDKLQVGEELKVTDNRPRDKTQDRDKSPCLAPVRCHQAVAAGLVGWHVPKWLIRVDNALTRCPSGCTGTTAPAAISGQPPRVNPKSARFTAY
jgi:hypothetical protein